MPSNIRCRDCDAFGPCSTEGGVCGYDEQWMDDDDARRIGSCDYYYPLEVR